MKKTKPYWIIKNKTDEDIPLRLLLWSGQEVDDVFHANEVAILHKEDSVLVLRYLDPNGEVFSIETKFEQVEKPNWKKEGF